LLTACEQDTGWNWFGYAAAEPNQFSIPVKLVRVEITSLLKNVAKLKDKCLEHIKNGWRS